MVAVPAQSHLAICSNFGHTRGEQRAGIPAGVVNGKIDIENATPWAVQVASDLQKLEQIDAGAELLAAMNGVQLSIFWDEQVKELFLNLDVTELRALELSTSIGPDFQHEDEEVPCEVPVTCRCDICKTYFADKKHCYFTCALNIIYAS